jgi:Leucine-rich repeat (LRR) protein
LITLDASENQLGFVESYQDANRNKKYDQGEPFNDVSGNGIRDSDPLSEIHSLTSLTYLQLNGNLIRKIDSMMNLPSLKVLLLSGNQIARIEGLSSFSALEKLSLNDNFISDISGIGRLKNLNFLSMSENRLCDLRELSQLTKLDELHLQYNHVKNGQVLSNLKNLVSLHMSNNLIQDLSFIKDLESIQRVNLRKNSMGRENELGQTIYDLGLRNISITVEDQKDKNPDLVSLIETLYSSSSANLKFGDFLDLNNYRRFIDFINTTAFEESLKNDFYRKWNFSLLNNRELTEVGFPEK